MVDLARWLGQQLDEDERIAREANTSPEMVTGIPRSYAAAPVALHIAEFADPARVLREIDAKRKLLDLHEATSLKGCAVCGFSLEYMGLGPWCTTLRLLALSHSDREGYSREWKP